MSYENFAYYYDSLMDEQFYEDYYQFILQHCQFDEVFELGCGTGEMAIRLAKSKKTVYASDISSDMLEVAKQKAIEQQVNLVLQRVDMCDFTLSRPVDLVLCLCDSLNYLTDPQQMTQTFLNVFQSSLVEVVYLPDSILRQTGKWGTEQNNVQAMLNRKDCAYPSPDHIQTWHSTYHRDSRNGWSRNCSFPVFLLHTNIVQPFSVPLLRLPNRSLHKIFSAWRKEPKAIIVSLVQWPDRASIPRT